jgi:hypothetical protein
MPVTDAGAVTRRDVPGDGERGSPSVDRSASRRYALELVLVRVEEREGRARAEQRVDATPHEGLHSVREGWRRFYVALPTECKPKVSAMPDGAAERPPARCIHAEGRRERVGARDEVDGSVLDEIAREGARRMLVAALETDVAHSKPTSKQCASMKWNRRTMQVGRVRR